MQFQRFVHFAVLCFLSATPAGFAQTRSFAQSSQQTVGNSPQFRGVDFSRLNDEALTWLDGLIRIDTSTPTNEFAAAKYVADILQKEGIPAEVHQNPSGGGVVIARLAASPFPDPAHALLLIGDLYAIPADKSKWQVDPFGAILQNGYLYGRGTVSGKSTVAAELAVLIALKRSNAQLSRDIILLADGGEEQGQPGMRFVVDNYWQKIAAGFALDEGGSVVLNNGKVQYVSIQSAEKVPARIVLTAKGNSSPAGVPAPDNAVFSLAAALDKIAGYKTPFHLTPITEAYFEQLSLVEDPSIGKWMNALDSPVRGDLALEKVAAANPIWNALLRDTIAPTKLKTDAAAGDVPTQAEATLDVGLLPGDSVDSILLNLKQAVNNPSISFSSSTSIGEAAPSSSLSSDLFKTIQQATQEEFPNVTVIPVMSPEATASAYLRLRNVQAYGLTPFPLSQQDADRARGDNERIPLNSFRTGLEYLFRVVSQFATEK